MIRITAICFCFVHFALLQAQTTSRFPIDPLAKWKISEISFNIEIEGSYEKINEKYEYFIDSDTTINSLKYYKLFKSGVAYYDTPFYYEKVYAGAIRDDDNRFYMVRKDQDAEVLLIDFNLEPGDTIRAEIGNGNIINNIEILADGRKCISSIPEICGGCCSTITLLEGIGHSGGIMEDPPCYHIGYYGHYLNCYEIDGELIYQTDIPLVVDCENFFSSVDDLPDIPDVKIHPVPATDMLSVDLLNMPYKQSFISIFNITGSLILTREIQSSHTDIDIQHLEKGIYLVRIYNEVTSNAYKLIVE
jgi:hypothetical protein